MSRYYEMYFTIQDLQAGDGPAVLEVLKQMWTIWSSHVDKNEREVTAGGESSLCGGQSEEEFAVEVAEAIWKRLGHYATVNVRATYLEDLPSEDYDFAEDEYAEYEKTVKGAGKHD